MNRIEFNRRVDRVNEFADLNEVPYDHFIFQQVARAQQYFREGDIETASQLLDDALESAQSFGTDPSDYLGENSVKLTKRQLRRIIKEEKAKLLKEADHGGGWDGVASSKHGCLSTNEFMHFLAGALQDAGCTLDAESWSYVQSGLDEIESEAYQMGMADGQ